MPLTAPQVTLYNVRAVIDDTRRDPGQAVNDLVWIISHPYPPYQGDMALKNGLPAHLLPTECRRFSAGAILDN